MNFKNEYYLLICTLLGIGCGSSSHETISSVLSSRPEVREETPVSAPSQSIEEAPQIQSMKAWSPHFIQTGLSSGIMVEFTGLKKDAPLKARYSSIELKRVTTAANENSQNIIGDQTGVITLNTTINNLRQAFYKVPPGKYIVRHTT